MPYAEHRKQDDFMLYGQFDADVWAKEFVKYVEGNPNRAKDIDVVRGWFANAIMTGYDKAKQEAISTLQQQPAEDVILATKKNLKQRIIYKLEETDYVKEWHKTLKAGLVGNLKNEYLMTHPIREPYEKFVETINDFVASPLFHAVVDMMIANIIHYSLEKLTELIIDQALTALTPFLKSENNTEVANGD